MNKTATKKNTVKVPDLTHQQVLTLRALLDEPEGLIAGELIKRGINVTPDWIGPINKEDVPKYPQSLIGLGLVTVRQYETLTGHGRTAYLLTEKGRKVAPLVKIRERGVSEEQKVPNKILDEAGAKVKPLKVYAFEYYTDGDLKEVRDLLPEQYNKVPFERIRQQLVNRRKQGAFATEKTFPDWYEAYRSEDDFVEAEDNLIKLNKGGCTLNSAHTNGLRMYHRKLEDDRGPILGREQPAWDCVVLCPECFKRCRKSLPVIPQVDPRD